MVRCLFGPIDQHLDVVAAFVDDEQIVDAVAVYIGCGDLRGHGPDQKRDRRRIDKSPPSPMKRLMLAALVLRPRCPLMPSWFTSLTVTLIGYGAPLLGSTF